MFNIKTNSIKVNAWMNKKEFEAFTDENLLSVFTNSDFVLTMYNGFIIGRSDEINNWIKNFNYIFNLVYNMDYWHMFYKVIKMDEEEIEAIKRILDKNYEMLVALS